MMAALSHLAEPAGGQEKIPTPPATAPATAGPINIGSRRELFVDDYLIDKMNGTRLKLHEPRCEGSVFRFDQRW